MYTTIRHFYPHGIEGEEMDCTFKEFDSIDKAITYAHRYTKGIRFAGVKIESEEGKLLYEITSDGDVIDYRGDDSMLKIIIPEDKTKLDKQIQALQWQIKNDVSQKDRDIHTEALQELIKARQALK